MKETLYTIKGGRGDGLLPLPAGDVLREAGADDLRVLLALLSLGRAGVTPIAEVLGIGVERVTASLAFWRGAGVVTAEEAAVPQPTVKEPTAERTPAPEKNKLRRAEGLSELGAEELATYLQKTGLASLVTEAERQRGRLLNRTDLSILLSLSQELLLSPEYILSLLAYCDAQGDGEPKPMRYVERVALRLTEHGIESYEALVEYLREQELLRSMEGGLRRMFGIGSRKLTAREEKAFLLWTDKYGYGEEVIGAAYDVTVNATGRASVAYADKVLAHWHECGVRTAEEAEALLLREREEKKPKRTRTPRGESSSTAASSFDVGDFFRRAVERSFKNEGNEENG